MNLEMCTMCQSHDVYVGKMSPQVRVLKPHSIWLDFGATVNCTVCLSCGFVAPYVGEDDLKKIRAWKAKETPK